MATSMNPVLRLAMTALKAKGFSTDTHIAGGREILLAENSYFLIGVIHVDNPSNLLRDEAWASTEMLELVGQVDLKSKQWDVYLVLILTERLPDEKGVAEQVFDISYNTAYIRRLVRTNVALSEHALEDALSSFLPLQRPPTDGVVIADPLLLLQEQLVLQGIDTQLAHRAITNFRQTRNLSGV